MTRPEPPVRRARQPVAAQRVTLAEEGQRPLVEPLAVLTWNVRGKLGPGKSAQAPSDDRAWPKRDNLDAIHAEVPRVRPDVFSLQECDGEAGCERFAADYCFLGARSGHCLDAGSVQLYVRKGLRPEEFSALSGVPGLGAVARVRGVEVAFVALHLANGAAATEKRKKHLRRALEVARGRTETVVVFGDLNMQDAELGELTRGGARGGGGAIQRPFVAPAEEQVL